MKNSILKLTSMILIILLALSIMPTAVRAADNTEGVILEKTDGEKVVYIKDMDATEFKYAFSNDDNESSVTYVTALKDSNNEYVALLEKDQTYNYMFIKNGENTSKIELDTLEKITEEEIKEVEKLTTIINVSTDESESKVSNNDGTTVTTTTGKIVIKDKGDYQYQLLEVVDKNGSTKTLNETAVELYNQLSELNNASKMYDKLIAEVKIRDDFEKLLKDAEWEDAENSEIIQPKDSQEGEKFVVLIREVDGDDTVREDVQFMTCGRKDDEGVEVTEKETTKKVEKKTALPVTGENLVLYVVFGIIILAIIILVIRMKKAKNNEEE